MLIFFQELILLIILWVLRMVEGIIEIYNIVLGMEIVNINNEKKDILSFILNDSRLLIIFISIFCISTFLCLVFTIVSIIKNMFQNNKTLSSIISKSFISIISTMVVFIILFIVVSISNILLSVLITSLDISTDLNISKIIFDNSVGNYLFDYTISEIDFSIVTPNQILGDYITIDNHLFPSQWELNGMINPNNFYYLPSFITSIIVLVSLIISILNIIKRIYKIVYLYITIPITLSTLPLDNGIKFSYWNNELFKQILIIFSSVFALKVFYLLLPILLNINISNNISIYSKSLINLFIISSGSLFITSSQSMLTKIFKLKSRMEQL